MQAHLQSDPHFVSLYKLLFLVVRFEFQTGLSYKEEKIIYCMAGYGNKDRSYVAGLPRSPGKAQ